MVGEQHYKVRQFKENRVKPSRLHHRYSVLVRLHDRLHKIVTSDLLPKGEAVLDYGCGDRPYEQLLRSKFRSYTAADLPGNTKADLVSPGLGDLPVEAASFDCVLSTQVLEHVADPRAYLREASRVLKPGGSLILSTHGVWRYHPDPVDYWRWTIAGLRLELDRASFQVIEIKGVLGLASTAILLWQDASSEWLPRWLRPPYFGMLQALISVVESVVGRDVTDNDSVYIALARKVGVDSSE